MEIDKKWGNVWGYNEENNTDTFAESCMTHRRHQLFLPCTPIGQTKAITGSTPSSTYSPDITTQGQS